MKVLDSGHKYSLLDNKSTAASNTLQFFKDPDIHGTGCEGTTNQEVLRALIDRVKFLEAEKPHRFNAEIISHLRHALVLHEMRHLERLVEKEDSVELIRPRSTGHYV